MSPGSRRRCSGSPRGGTRRSHPRFYWLKIVLRARQAEELYLRLELAHRVAQKIRHPDVGPIEGHIDRTIAHSEGAQRHPVAGTQLAHRVAKMIRHPEANPISRQELNRVLRQTVPHSFLTRLPLFNDTGDCGIVVIC